MPRVLLIRHAQSTANRRGVLTGQTPGVSLSAQGRVQSQELALRLGKAKLSQLRVSPMQRCIETIEPWINAQRKFQSESLIVDHGVNELDFGDWTGRKVSSVSMTREWARVQKEASKAKFPNGESLKQVQRRARSSFDEAVSARGRGAIGIVTHADVIKVLVADLLNLHLDEFQKIVIDNASVTVFDYNKGKVKLLTLNDSRSQLSDLING
jgi:probable phosphoglycerate mutase